MTQLTFDQTEVTQGIIDTRETLNRLQPISDALGRIFVSDKEQTRVQKLRVTMGELVANLSDEELETYITEFQYLIDEWLDEFERAAFDGQTLKQTLVQE
jgi:hypothetical protein